MSRHAQWLHDLSAHGRKNHEIMFEACKHFTTLDTAAALIGVAVFRETSNGVAAVIGPLAWFGFSIVLCGYGMIATALGGLGNTKVAVSTGIALVSGALLFGGPHIDGMGRNPRLGWLHNYPIGCEP